MNGRALRAALLVMACSPAPVPTEEPYDAFVREGEKRLAAGQLAAARAAFTSAAAEIWFEVPNYRVLVRLAEVECRDGDRVQGVSTLTDFRCMLAVDRGQRPCFVGAPTREAPGLANPALTAECLRRMCGELYLSYYEHPTPESLSQVTRLEHEADRVEALCSASAR